MDAELRTEAREWLDQLYEELVRDPRYARSGAELLNHLEWEIRRYAPDLVQAVTAALQEWLTGDDAERAEYAVDLLVRLGAVEYVPVLERIREALLAGRAQHPPEWLVDAALTQLRQQSEQKSPYPQPAATGQ